jgi:uncharacterized protein YndB with AHSA1/START domain
MSEQLSKRKETSDGVLEITRVFNAPRELVYNVWTDPEHIVHWWGPNGFTNTIRSMDLRAGGVWELVMHGPDGVDYPNKIEFIEVVKPERLVYKHRGEKGFEPVNFHVTILFEDQGDKTKLTMRMVFESAEELRRVNEKYGAIEGAYQMMDRFDNYITEIKL